MSHFITSHPVILISGKQGSGKSTLAYNLIKLINTDKTHKYTARVVRFAGPLYEMHDAVVTVASRYGIPTEEKEGKLLQLLGTEWGRETKGQDVWIKAMRNLIRDSPDDQIFIIEDCRFQNELEAFPEAFRIRLEAEEDTRKERARGWRDNTAHASEIDLDGVEDFDVFIRTDDDRSSKEEKAAAVYSEIKTFWSARK